MIFILPAAISAAQGFLLVNILIGKADRPRWPWILFAGALLGLGISGLLTFTSLLFFNQIIPIYVIGINLTVLALLTGLCLNKGLVPFFRPSTGKNIKMRIPFGDIAIILILAALTIPSVIHATLYPYGGWDAWSCWNLKARFIFLGGTAWTGIFDPIMWRSNTAYPLLLPLINVWMWCFGNGPDPLAPLINSCLITFLTGGLLYFSLDELNEQKYLNLLAPALLLLNPFILKLASSQYSDLLMGVFLLLSIASFFIYDKSKNSGALQVAAIALGLMSFTKSEGLALSIVATIVFGTAIALKRNDRKALSRHLGKLALTLAAAFLATGIFQFIYAPNSHTFINGLTSTEKPTSLERLNVVFVFLGRELTSLKWSGLWALLAAGLILSWKRVFRNELWTIPTTILAYLTIIFGFYWVNTFFEVVWWLSTTLNRILFALIPTFLLWLFLSIY